jgi:hypothetical protein
VTLASGWVLFTMAAIFLGLGYIGVPVDRLVANLNADMVGRNWPDTIVAIGKEHSDLGTTLERVNAAHPDIGMTAIDDLWPDEQFYFRSDHFNFARKAAPSGTACGLPYPSRARGGWFGAWALRGAVLLWVFMPSRWGWPRVCRRVQAGPWVVGKQRAATRPASVVRTSPRLRGPRAIPSEKLPRAGGPFFSAVSNPSQVEGLAVAPFRKLVSGILRRTHP